MIAFPVVLMPLEKEMNPIILPPIIAKHYGRIDSLSLVRQPIYKENFKFKPVILRFKNWPYVTP